MTVNVKEYYFSSNHGCDNNGDKSSFMLMETAK